MSELTIPHKLRSILDRDSGLALAVDNFVSDIASPLIDNRLFFFPDFTDHSIRHIQIVLDTMSELIAEDAFETLTSGDIFLLVVSCLVHDLGMQIYEEGFKELIENGRPIAFTRLTPKPPLFANESSWKDNWLDFLSEARRWNTRQNITVFGLENPKTTARIWNEFARAVEPANKLPNLDDQFGKRLIGEFVRRHHARLAHEITLAGFPGLAKQKILFEEVGEIADLAGFVARSHHHPIRKCADFVTEQLERKVGPKDTHFVYSMALIRLSDYLQLDFKRAPTVLFNLRRPSSPLSRREWQKHEILDLPSYAQRDLSTIHFPVCKKPSLEVLLAIRNLLEDVQREFDETNGSLLEHYPRNSDLDALRLAFTRVKCDIHQESFLDTLSYIPETTEITVDPGVVPLMVEPLYGDMPSFGIRELLQNAVDAVRERIYYCKTNKIDSSKLAWPEFDGDVEIALYELDGGCWRLEVVDKGIGMTKEIIQNCFLRAGASFRNEEQFLQDFTDKDGKAKIARSGRFGVGVFAGFLLGDCIRIETKHLTDEHGYEFDFRLSDDSSGLDSKGLVTVNKARKLLKVGTSISVELSSQTVNKIHLLHNLQSHELRPSLEECCGTWDWFAHENPKVIRKLIKLDGTVVNLTNHSSVPQSRKELTQTWHEIRAKGFTDVFWSIDDKTAGLVCNGIKIGSPAKPSDRDKHILGHRTVYSGRININPDSDYPTLMLPPISLTDKAAILPLTLKREAAIADFVPDSLIQSLRSSMLLDWVAFCLVCAPYIEHVNSPLLLGSVSPLFLRYPYQQHSRSELGYQSFELKNWVVCGDEVFPFDSSLLKVNPFKRLLFIGFGHSHDQPSFLSVSNSQPSGDEAVCYLMDSRYPHYLHSQSTDDHLSALVSLIKYTNQGNLPGLGSVKGAAVLVGARPDRLESALAFHSVSKPKHIGGIDDQSLKVYTAGEPAGSLNRINDFGKQIYDAKLPAAFRELTCPIAISIEFASRKKTASQRNELIKTWHKIIGPRGLPLAKDERDNLIQTVCEQNETMIRHVDGWKQYDPVYRSRQR